MKTLRKILLIGIAIFALIFIAAYVFLYFHGKAIITKQLESIIHKKVNIDNISLRFPINFEVKNLDIPSLTKVDYIFIAPSILGLLTGNIVLNEIKLIRPQFIYERTPVKKTEPPAGANTANASTVLSSRIVFKREQSMHLALKRLFIKDGRLDFIDRTLDGNGIKITIKDLNFNLTNLFIYPRSAITNFELSGMIPWLEGKEEGRVEAEGWLNLFKKDMQATLKIKDIDGLSLYPYYSSWVDLEKTRIEKAKLNLTSNIHSVNDDLIADCHLELTDIAFKPRSSEETKEKFEKIAAVVFDVFKALNNGKVILNFSIKTKMSNPKFGFIDVKDAFESRLAEGLKNNRFTGGDIIRFPNKVVGGTVKGAADLSRGLIDGTFGLVEELKEAFEYAFKKE